MQISTTDLQTSACIWRVYVLWAIPGSDFLCLFSSVLPRKKSKRLSKTGRSAKSGGPLDHLQPSLRLLLPTRISAIHKGIDDFPQSPDYNSKCRMCSKKKRKDSKENLELFHILVKSIITPSSQSPITSRKEPTVVPSMSAVRCSRKKSTHDQKSKALQPKQEWKQVGLRRK